MPSKKPKIMKMITITPYTPVFCTIHEMDGADRISCRQETPVMRGRVESKEYPLISRSIGIIDVKPGSPVRTWITVMSGEIHLGVDTGVGTCKLTKNDGKYYDHDISCD